MAKRALLYDQLDQFLGYRSFAEIDYYVERNWVERLTPLRSSTHVFRLTIKNVIESCRKSAASLNARINQANAGACEKQSEMYWARRKVKVWPFVGDRKAVRVGCRTQMFHQRRQRLEKMKTMYLDDAVKVIARFNYPIAWMHQNSEGAVCIGCQHQITVAAAVKMPFELWTAAPAAVDDIRHEFARVKVMRAGMTFDRYRIRESVLLPKATMLKLLRDDVSSRAAELFTYFPNFDVYPECVRVALLDYTFLEGIPALSPPLHDAIAKQNWPLASTLCRRNSIGKEQNDWLERQFTDVPVAV